MAQGSKGAARHAPSAPNGSTPTTASASAVSSAPAPAPAVNRKKQKRRQKQAAKDAAGAGQQPPPSDHPHHHDRQSAPHYQEYDDDDSEYAYGTYAGSPGRVNGHVNGHASAADTAKKPKKKKGKPADPHPLAASARPSTEDVWSPAKDDDSKQIKDFWLQLTDAERKSLLALEKDAVLKAMRETSQRQTCGCAICGRRRGAIEAELEYLYAQYFNDLVHSNPGMPHRIAAPVPDGRYDEDDEDNEGDECSEDGYRDARRGPTGHSVASEMFNLGQNLAVKGMSLEVALQRLTATDGILTVADDLLKNEGKRFIDMMEQLAERRLAREEETQYMTHHHAPHDSAYAPSPEEALEDEDNLDEDGDYGDEGGDEADEEEDMDEARGPAAAHAPANRRQEAMSEDQRTEESRRMFHLFAARMFEQRVVSAYKAKVALDRQQQLLMELEEEKTNDVQREAKKQRDAQKKKEKKMQQKQAKAEEKARKEAEKKAEEDAAKAEEARKQEELRKKKEEQRKKKDAERKAQDEERMRREAERIKKQQEERDRQLEAERKAREQKALEKKAKDDLRRKEREEKEAKERELKEKKAQAEKARREQEDKARAEKEAQERARRDARDAQAAAAREAREAHAAKAVQAAREAQAQAHAQAQASRDAQAQAQAQIQAAAQQAVHARRAAAAATPVAVPGLPRNPSSFSPHVAVATPVMPKAPTPVRARPGSQQGSKGSSPRTPYVSTGSGKSVSPAEAATRKTAMPKIPPAPLQAPPAHSVAPPPGMLPSLFNSSQPQNGFQPGGMPIRAPPPMFPLQAQSGANQYRPPQPILPPPGLPSMNRILSEGPPGLTQSGPLGLGAAPIGQSQHARQTSGSSQYELMGAQPIQRPIGRPSSTKPEDGMDELSAQLGSSALLGDRDEPFLGEHRRPGPPGLTGLPAMVRSGSAINAFGASPIFPQGQQRVDGFGPGSSNPSSAWGTPPSTLPFSQPGVATISPGGPAASASWSSPASAWGPAPTAGVLPSAAKPASGVAVGGGRPRPLTIRLQTANFFKRLIGGKMMAPDGWQELGALLRHMDQCVSPPVSAQELLDICDTEGNEHNGGGEFHVRMPASNVGPAGAPVGIESVLVRYVFDGAGVDGKDALAGAGKAVGGLGSPPVGALGLAGAGPGPPPGLFPGLGGHHAAGFH